MIPFLGALGILYTTGVGLFASMWLRPGLEYRTTPERVGSLVIAIFMVGTALVLDVCIVDLVVRSLR